MGKGRSFGAALFLCALAQTREAPWVRRFGRRARRACSKPAPRPGEGGLRPRACGHDGPTCSRLARLSGPRGRTVRRGSAIPNRNHARPAGGPACYPVGRRHCRQPGQGGRPDARRAGCRAPHCTVCARLPVRLTARPHGRAAIQGASRDARPPASAARRFAAQGRRGQSSVRTGPGLPSCPSTAASVARSSSALAPRARRLNAGVA
ncbi:hypothetical protein SAMN04488568_1285 [Maricaulis salignorans]|uniref:Uncharacterized protein n=1 Tax=Maricaulis salignorans TaxID=144026 RepID=A0A1G9WU73_9PROT|nr:hypothetical protein SAMN04488568_1285 [Maricaulis salignorans]